MSTAKEFLQYLDKLNTDLLGMVLTSDKDYEDNVTNVKERLNLAHFFRQGYSAEFLMDNKDSSVFFSLHGLFDNLEAILKGDSVGYDIFKQTIKYVKTLDVIDDEDIPAEMEMSFYQECVSTYKSYQKPKTDD